MPKNLQGRSVQTEQSPNKLKCKLKDYLIKLAS